MWGTTPPCAKLTGNSGNAFEAALICDLRSFRALAENQPQCLFEGLADKLNSEQIGVTLASVWTLAASASRQVEFGALLHSGACLSRKAGFTADEQTPKC
jgi:hypothetical protein